jgi:hypothetical protein
MTSAYYSDRMHKCIPTHVSGVKRHLQEALHSSFWCELRALLAVGFLKVVIHSQQNIKSIPTRSWVLFRLAEFRNL